MFTQAQINEINRFWGQEIFAKILCDVKIYSEKWQLSDMCFYENYSMNAIFFCKSEMYGDCVLKIGNGFQNKEFMSEHNMLREYNGKRFVKVFESDVETDESGKKVMLIERIIPGTTLQTKPLLENRLSVFSDLYTGLHIKPNNPELYQTYVGKMDCYAEIIGRQTEYKELYSHAMKAKDIYKSVSAEYPEEMLLHGDFHFNNILLNGNGTYTIIDPQGLVGDPVFEISRYIMIEHYHYTNKEKSLKMQIENVNKMIDYFTHRLLIPESTLRKCFYVEMVTMECLDASNGRCDINNVIFADMI